MQATKSVIQGHRSFVLSEVLQRCLTLTYNAISYAESNQIDNRKGMKEFYRSLRGVDLPSCWKVAVITRACAVVKSREKGKKRRKQTRHRKPLRASATIINGFFTTVTGKLFVSLGHDRYDMIQLNRYSQGRLEGMRMRSLTLTPDSVSICYSKEVDPVEVETVYGVDRNEKNLTFGNSKEVVQVDVSKAVKVRQMTREIVGSFRRDDVRIRKKVAAKYWTRATHRTKQVLHDATNFIVSSAANDRAALAFEDLKGIRRMYRRGNGQGNDYRFRLNSWPHWMAYKMMDYKARWRGLPVIQLTKAETMGSSSTHACGERLRNPARDDMRHRRMQWCEACEVWVDRDVNAAMVLSERGLTRLASSLPRPVARNGASAGEKGLAVEAMRRKPTPTAILRVDASKLRCR